MENENTPKLTKEIFVTLFNTWINQRPGLDPRDYGSGYDGWRAYRNEANRIAKDRREALERLNTVAHPWTPFDAALLFKACDWAFSGRLQVKYQVEKGWYIDYTTGQYWPTEYRIAAYAVLDRYGDFLYQAQVAAQAHS